MFLYNDKNLVFKIERFSKDVIKDYLNLSKEDFKPRTEQFMTDYSEKLSLFANFVTCKGKDGQLLGLIAFYSNSLPEAFISHVWVSKDMRGQGICGKMLDRVCNYCIKKNFETICLEVRCDNYPAINAYQKFGFEKYHNYDYKYLMRKDLHI